MNAGKSMDLIKTAYNYDERGFDIAVFNYEHDKRFGENLVASRAGVKWGSKPFNKDTVFLENDYYDEAILLIDEAQFLTNYQVSQLIHIKNTYSIPIICYGLRTDFQGDLFEGSKWLLAWADNVEELKTICHCGKKATMQIRKDRHGKRILDGEQEQIGDECYESVCSYHFWEPLFFEGWK